MKIENFIAFRYFKNNKKNKNISSSFKIVVIVIAASIIFFISAVSIMNGYIYGLMKLIFDVKSYHITYTISKDYGETKEIYDYLATDKRIKEIGLYREENALLSANGKNTGLVYFRSMNENIFNKDKDLNRIIKLVSGKKSLEKNYIMISKTTADKLNVKVNDHIFVTLMVKDSKAKIVVRRLKISGIFTSGFVELDEQLAYIGRETGNRLFPDNTDYNIFIKLKDYRQAEDFRMWYENLGYYGMTTWLDSNYNELEALQFEKNIIAFIVILVVLVASLNILSTIYITILEKSRDIGILKSIGYSPRNIIVIFLLNGIYLGFIGIVTGISLGLLLMNWLNEILRFFSFLVNVFQNSAYYLVKIFYSTLEKPYPFVIFPKNFYLDKIYTEISFNEIFLIAILAMIFSIAASIIPAIKAGYIKPNEAIRDDK